MIAFHRALPGVEKRRVNPCSIGDGGRARFSPLLWALRAAAALLQPDMYRSIEHCGAELHGLKLAVATLILQRLRYVFIELTVPRHHRLVCGAALLLQAAGYDCVGVPALGPVRVMQRVLAPGTGRTPDQLVVSERRRPHLMLTPSPQRRATRARADDNEDKMDESEPNSETSRKLYFE